MPSSDDVSSDNFQRGPDEGHIADTGMFQRFVEKEAELESRSGGSASARRWMMLIGIVVIVAVGVVVWTLIG